MQWRIKARQKIHQRELEVKVIKGQGQSKPNQREPEIKTIKARVNPIRVNRKSMQSMIKARMNVIRLNWINFIKVLAWSEPEVNKIKDQDQSELEWHKVFYNGEVRAGA